MGTFSQQHGFSSCFLEERGAWAAAEQVASRTETPAAIQADELTARRWRFHAGNRLAVKGIQQR